MDTALAIMVKQPAPGRVKTRLCPPLTPEDAAALYRCFLLDKMAQVQRIRATIPYLAFTPGAAAPFFRGLAGEAFSLVAQDGNDLGERLGRLSSGLLAAGHPGVVIIDSDTPNLPDEYLAEAVGRLRDGQADAVFGPAEDGGYYLVGLSRPSPSLFEGIAWSTPAVLEETLGKAARARLRLSLLPPWFDVDTGPDLERLANALAGNGGLARHTAAFLHGLAAARGERKGS